MFELKRDLNSLPLTWVGHCAYFLSSYKKRSNAKKNIDFIFQPSLSPAEKKCLCVAYYSHITTNIKEIILFALVSKKSLEKCIKVIGIEHLENALGKGKGILVFTGHFGNWEFAPLFFLDKFNSKDLDFYCVRKNLRFAFLDSIFLRQFENCGFKIISHKNAVSQIRRALKSNAIVFFPFDVCPSSKIKNKIKTDFLGQKTETNLSLAYLASLYDSCVLSISFYRTNKKQHVVHIYPEVKPVVCPDYKQTLVENTQLYNKRLEEMLLPYPEQWLWSYKRWTNNG
ncbi:TPA: lipid A biosynthesis acyltransferase [Legionella pneumophila subsp. pneumophila]|uniref:lysophospholipid acyltransferase family protein n=1 Tax=Legionella pneumophila TaxID=446 RepID=UPI0001527F44|nr:lysophospholipid acyltransferase family protein [Legionella pneumophila]HAT8849766.1 lipid A biosynthesis acyltransferase [Legionella pneumophila subsp. pneumophila]ABQ57139.1 Lipid A biosynthesis lauroyl acyltransferase [Legionella pneumophila str. Corby]MDI9825172.1 lysophospholipid acyltransferase family protein [Legionella pneumophila]CZI26442.1 lipid A biosynthesis lauroyl acyltransferase [Legionella pneumophila]CZI68190.1 lipid A biosynthesis lauroyl acyltransferase [Legionella pneumo